MQRTLVLAKPDAIQRGLVGEIVSRFERKGLKLIGLKMLRVDDALLDEHYAHHKDKDFFVSIVRFMKSSPLVAIVLEGLGAVKVVRALTGPTLGREAPPGTIRGDFSLSIQHNIVHASETAELAEEEINRFFEEGELFDYYKSEYLHVYGLEELPEGQGEQ